MTFPPDLAVADPLDCLAYVAAVTSELLLGTAVLVLPYHHPVVLAKRLATIDVLSRGRMSLLTVGLGVLPGEAAAAGVDFGTHGRRADEAIDVLRLLWGGDAADVSFQGEFFSLAAACSLPKPHGGRILPIHIGGSSLAAARTAGRRGDGYFPGGRLTLEQRNEQLVVTRVEAAAAGRDATALEYTRWGQIDMTADDVQALASAGVTRLVVSPGSTEQRECGPRCPHSPAAWGLAEPRPASYSPTVPGARSEVCAEDFNSAAGCSASVDTGIGGDQRDVEGFG